MRSRPGLLGRSFFALPCPLLSFSPSQHLHCVTPRPYTSRVIQQQRAASVRAARPCVNNVFETHKPTHQNNFALYFPPPRPSWGSSHGSQRPRPSQTQTPQKARLLKLRPRAQALRAHRAPRCCSSTTGDARARNCRRRVARSASTRPRSARRALAPSTRRL